VPDKCLIYFKKYLKLGVSYGYVQKILKKHKMHPNKVDFVQHLRVGDSMGGTHFDQSHFSRFKIKLAMVFK
jgi:hypothetical protein